MQDKQSLQQPSRRHILKKTFVLSTLSATGLTGLSMPTVSYAAALTQGERDKMTPEDVIERFKQGNVRFRKDRLLKHDFRTQKRSSVTGQFPAAVILSCIDSRAPAEILFDAGIGDTFNTRVAGNISNDDILGSLEFACEIAGAKLVLVLGHTGCGAVRGAISHAELGHLTGLLDKIKPAIASTKYAGERLASNREFVDAVARQNVELTVQSIRKSSPVLKSLEDKKHIKIIGAMYHLHGGKVDFFEA
jgi:carbonic anhydrase